jgi:hypothetical protein
MTGPQVPMDPAMGAQPTDEYVADTPERTAQDRRDELKHAEIAGQNVQMRHVPTGEVTTYNRNQLSAEKLHVPALREDFPRDQFEEVT